jgi:hypothetical protein
MMYAVPLTDGSFGIAQAGEAMWPNVIYVALFVDRYRETPAAPPLLKAASAVSLAATWRQALNRGEWLSLAWAAEVFKKAEFPNERFSKAGYVGAKTYDAGILADFLSAFHGLVPWNVMHDPDYYDRLLRPGVERPKAALVLDEVAREKYRRETLRVDA